MAVIAGGKKKYFLGRMGNTVKASRIKILLQAFGIGVSGQCQAGNAQETGGLRSVGVITGQGLKSCMFKSRAMK